MSDEDLKLNRRLFLQQSAVATATAGAAYSIAMKTDAVAQVRTSAGDLADPGGENVVIPYLYGNI